MTYRPIIHAVRDFALAAIMALAAAAPALAADGGQAGPSEVIFLFQIMALIFCGRMLGEGFQRIGQPAVTGQLIAGILLGPSFFGLIWPDAQHYLFPPAKEQKAMIDAVSQVGILLLLLLTGMETDLRLVRRAGRAAFSVSVSGIVVPFLCGFALGEVLPDSMIPKPELRIITSLFLGTALSIASIKIVAMVVREMNFMRRNLGQLIVSSAIIDDSVGWIIISIIFSLAEHGAIDLFSLARSVLGTLAFLAISLTIGRRAVFFIIRFTNDNFVSELPVLSAILLIMGGMALITHYIGVHTVLGAFVAGVLVGESPILTRQIDEQLRGLITAFFAPVFFGLAGIGTDLTILRDPALLALTVGLILIASVGKFGGAFIGGRFGGLRNRESLALALGMNARGSTEVIIATIGLSLGALNHDLFSMIVAMAVVTTMAMPPTLRWALARVPLRKEEAERLEREAFAERGFVPNIERQLLAIDDSSNGTFAARLSGVLVGALGTPTTILHIDPSPEAARKFSADEDDSKNTKTEPAQAADAPADQDGDKGKSEKKAAVAAKTDAKADDLKAKSDEATEAIRSGAEHSKPLGGEHDDEEHNVDVTIRTQDAPLTQAIADEAKKGYDLLFVGLGEMTSAPGVFHQNVSAIARGFEGPLAVVVGKGKHLKRPLQSRFRILVPVTGTGVSRRGAEVALALAHAAHSQITALFVASAPATSHKRLRFRQALATRRSERAILKDVAEMADKFNTPITITARTDDTAETAILREAKRGGYDLIVLGVSRRPGDTLFFGGVAAEVLEHTDASILFLASEAYGQERRPTEKEEVAT